MLLQVAEDATEQRHVAVDQIQPALIRLAPQPGCDADHVCILRQFRPPGNDPLISHQRRAMQQVQRLPFDEVLVDVHERDLADNAAELECECRARADQAAAADDGGFHVLVIGCRYSVIGGCSVT